MRSIAGFRFLITSLVVLSMLGSTFLLDRSPVSDNVFEVLGFEVLDINRVGNWSVTTTEVYTDTTIHLSGNLSVSGMLVLDNCDLILNTSSEVPLQVEVKQGGTLIVRNRSSLYTTNAFRYTFRADRGSTVQINRSLIRDCGMPSPDPRDQGIYSRSANFRFIGSEVIDSETGLILDGGKLDIMDSNITRVNSGGIIAFNGSVINATRVRISQLPGTGMRLDGSILNLTRCTFTEVETSIIALNSSINMVSSQLTGIGRYCMLLNSTTAGIKDSGASSLGAGQVHIEHPAGLPSVVFFLNCTFMGIFNDDIKGDVREGYRFDVKVMTNGPVPAEDADVELKDRTGKKIFQGLTGPDGYIYDIPIAVLVHNVTGGFPLSPHNVSVMHEGATRYSTVDVNTAYYVQIMVLRSDPEVVIEYPTEGEWLPDSSFHLVGKIMDPRPITDIWMSLDGRPEIRVPQSSPFSILLDIPDGPHHIKVTAKNDDGRYGNATVNFGIDTVFPDLKVSSPVTPYYTNKTSVWIRGTCSVDADLIIKGEKVPHPEGSFVYMVLLNEGRNDVVLKAVDRAGNSVTDQITVHVDSKPPSILVFSPSNGTRINKHEVQVRGKTDADTEHLWVNGEEAELDLGEFEVLVTDLVEGHNHIEITAQDRTGTRSVKYVAIIVDTTPPSLSITEAPHLTNEYTATIRGVTDPGSRVAVNNQIVTVEGGVFSAVVDLLEGANNITITASDDLGNRRSVNRHIVLDVDPPTFESIDPPSGSVVSNPILEITGTVYDENGIEAVRLKTGDQPFEEISREAEFRKVLGLSKGSNIVDIEAEDEAGNIAFKQVVYTYTPKVSEEDLEPPTIVITSPLPNSTLEAGRHTIEGWAMDDTELASVHVRIDGGGWMNVSGLNTWYVEVDLDVGKIYLIEARALDPSGNEKIYRVWTTVVIPSDTNGDDKGSSGTVILVVIGLLALIVAGVFGYMLLGRNRNLRQQLELMRERNRLKEQTRSRRGQRRVRSVRAGRPPGDQSTDGSDEWK
ncbi:MAG: Ig-like domain-containing protein [Thermoplasmatota archaeon]